MAAVPRLVEIGEQPPTWAESTGQKIVVAIPCLNEESHIGSLVLRGKPFQPSNHGLEPGTPLEWIRPARACRPLRVS